MIGMGFRHARLLFGPCDRDLCCKPVVQLVTWLEAALLGKEIRLQSNPGLKLGGATLGFGRDELSDVLVALCLCDDAVADSGALACTSP